MIEAISAKVLLWEAGKLGISYRYPNDDRQIHAIGPDDWPVIRRLEHAGQLTFADAAAKGVAMTYEDVLLLIAADEGQGVATYAKRAGVSKTVMSHWINELSDRARHRKTPGLVAWQPHPLKEREAQVFLTPLGVLAAEQLQGRRRP